MKKLSIDSWRVQPMANDMQDTGLMLRDTQIQQVMGRITR